MTSRAAPLRTAYRLLHARFGHQHWWPAPTPLEVCVGAILVQNTGWTQAERAVARLKSEGLLASVAALHAAPPGQVEEAIRSAGTYRVKARRLRAFTQWICAEFGGSLDRVWAGPMDQIRPRLLAVPGIGPETADCMLLYAGNHHAFVLDAHTRRVFERHGWTVPGTGDDGLRATCERSLADPEPTRQLDLWQDFHAQMVAVGKSHCRARDARCDGCPLQPLLRPRRGEFSVSSFQFSAGKKKSE
ncbi:MAG: endonuclease III domain-containing protein [Verrucomicrobia bacterium]|nr:endonuclease III domain-containing protein [Verrucomicrobiota bacterium]